MFLSSLRFLRLTISTQRKQLQCFQFGAQLVASVWISVWKMFSAGIDDVQLVTAHKCPQFWDSAQGMKQMFQCVFFIQNECSVLIWLYIYIVTSVGVVAVIDVVRSQIFYVPSKASFQILGLRKCFLQPFGPWPASLMSCTGLGHLEPRSMAQSVLDENHKK